MDVFDLAAKLSLDSSEYNSGLSTAESKINSFSTVLRSALKAITVATTTAISGAATGISALTKSAVSSYSNYEQLVGGVETLFGAQGMSIEEYAESVGKTVQKIQSKYNFLIQAQTEVMNNAKEAYKTAGMSANEYMETVTSFAASLIQSTGNTTSAAKFANLAITDMSDNANKMGTNIENIKNAYQGFAKQNYTMLDNLKLGYGGTKEEMKRLIYDAESLDKTFKASRDGNKELTLSYAEIVKAIHIIQTNMGITGTTAKEAASTIQGSLNSMKAAWSNLVTGLANGDADLDTLIDQLVETATTFMDNIEPVVIKSVQGIGKLIKSAAPIIADILPEVLKEIMPDLVKASISLVGVVTQSLPDILNSIRVALTEWLNEQPWGKSLLKVIDVIFNIAEKAITKIKNLIVNTDWQSTEKKWTSFVATVRENFEKVKTIVSKVMSIVKKELNKIDWETIRETWINFTEKVQQVWENIKTKASEIIQKIKGYFKSIDWESIKQTWSDFVDKVKEKWENIKTKASEIIQKIKGYFESIDWESIKKTWTDCTTKIKEAWDGLVEKLQPHIENLKIWFDDLKEKVQGLKDKFDDYVTSGDAAEESTYFLETAITAVSRVIESAITGVTNIIGKLEEFSTWLNSDSAGAEALKTGIVGLTAGIVAYKAAMIASNAISAAGTAITNGLAIAQAALNTVMSANPIGVVIALITALVAAIIYLWNTNDDFRNGLIEFWELIKQSISDIGESLKKFFTETIPEAFNTAVEFLEGLPEKALTWGKDLIDNFVQGIKDKIETVKTTVSNVADTIKDFLGFSEPDEGPLSNFHTYAPDMMNLFAKGIRDNKDVITRAIEDSFDLGNQIAANMSVSGVETATKRSEESNTLTGISEALNDFKASFYDDMVNALSDGLSFDVNGRTFGRLIKNYG